MHSPAEGIRHGEIAHPERNTDVSVVGNKRSVAVVIVLADNPVPLAHGYWFACFQIESMGAIAEFGEDFVSTLPRFKVHGNPRAGPGSPCSANILEYPSCGGKVPIDGPAEALIVLLDALTQVRVQDERTRSTLTF